MKHVTFHLPSFLRRVRIHGGEFDSSARAMNRVSEKGSLMTYERAFLTQADLRIVRGSTIERKQMSTTIKRVALVAVAALGLSLVSVAPSNAAINSDTLTLSAATAAQTTAETFTATSAVATLSFLGAVGDSASVTAALVSGPAGNTALPYLRLTETSSATINEAHSTAVGTAIAPNTAVRAGAVSASAVTTAKFAVYLGKGDATTAPSVAGTYVVRVTPASVGASGSLLGATAQTLTITVTAAPALDTVAASATSILNKGETASATADVTVAQPKTASTTVAAATIKVSLLNAAAAAVTAESYTAVITGPGILGSGANSGTTITGPNATGRAITVQNGHVVQVFPDGTSGVATITISSAAGKVLATETVTFYGDVASIVATVVKPVVGVRAETGVITAVAKDAAGVTIDAPTLYITSSDLTVVNASYASAASSADGKVTFGFTGLKAGTANFTVSNGSTAALSTVSAAAVSVRVAGGTSALDGLLVTLDKTSYAPGEAATVTVTPLDAAGLVLADDTYTVFTSAGLVASYALPSGSETINTATAQNGGVAGTGTAKGVATYKIYMPSIEGDFKLSWTRSSSYATAANDDLTGSITVAVSSPGTAAATDAANEATDAANAATDAALAAAEAADAATTAAQEASDAVAALSESVTKLIAGLQAQIKSLAAVVAKIAKKVKA